VFSVIIPTYNATHLLHLPLDSIRTQTLPPEEVIVVDDASTEDIGGFLAARYPDVKIVRNETNKGFAGAVNAGIMEARGRHIVLLNNDAAPARTWLEALRCAIEQHPEAGSFASKMLFHGNRTELNGTGIRILNNGRAVDRFKGEADDGRFDEDCFVLGACAGAACYRRELFENVGLFDEDFFAYFEDVDLSLRAQLAGYRCVYVPKAVVYHMKGQSFESSFKRYLNHRNCIYYLVKNIPASLLVKHCFPMLWRNLLHPLFRYGLSFKKGAARAYFTGKLDALRALPALLKKRTTILARRRADDAYLESLFMQ